MALTCSTVIFRNRHDDDQECAHTSRSLNAIAIRALCSLPPFAAACLRSVSDGAETDSGPVGA